MRNGLQKGLNAIVYGVTTGLEVDDMHPSIETGSRFLSAVSGVFSSRSFGEVKHGTMMNTSFAAGPSGLWFHLFLCSLAYLSVSVLDWSVIVQFKQKGGNSTSYELCSGVIIYVQVLSSTIRAQRSGSLRHSQLPASTQIRVISHAARLHASGSSERWWRASVELWTHGFPA